MKLFRWLVAFPVFLLMSGCFVFWSSGLEVLAKLQFGPNLVGVIRALEAGTLVNAAFALGVLAAIVLLTLLGGRWYCSVWCPFGILQDLLRLPWRLLSRRRSALRPQPQPPHRAARWCLAALVLAALVTGWVLPFARLEPFTNFGDIAGGVLRPAIIAANHELLPGIPQEQRPEYLSFLTMGALLLLTLWGLVIWRGRIFCTLLCPVGTLLGAAAKNSLFRMRLDPERCVKCGACAKVCPGGCLDPVAGKLDAERCLLCMECLSRCRFGALRYGVSHDLADVPEPATAPERRRFLGEVALAAGTGVLAGRLFRPAAQLLKADCTTSMPVLPPGAVSAERFAATCTGCGLCVANCTGNVLRLGGLEYGWQRLGQPHLAFEQGMCEFTCNNCSQVCPAGALLPLTVKAKQRTRIGLAEYHPDLCIAVVDGTECGACAEHCPTGALRMVPGPNGARIPALTAELCIGCGSCRYACPVVPLAAIRVNGIAVQEEARTPEEYFQSIAKPEAPAVKSDDWAF